MSDNTQYETTFTKKVKKKEPGAGGIMALGIVGVVACVAAMLAVVVLMNG